VLLPFFSPWTCFQVSAHRFASSLFLHLSFWQGFQGYIRSHAHWHLSNRIFTMPSSQLGESKGKL
jgi:hypothetical protein